MRCAWETHLGRPNPCSSVFVGGNTRASQASMYALADPVAAAALRHAVRCLAKASEHVAVEATAADLVLSTANSSGAVGLRARFPATAFSEFGGPHARVLVRARAADLILAQADDERVRVVRLRFGTAAGGQELAEIALELEDGTTKTFQVPSLLDVALVAPPALGRVPFYLSANVAALRSVLAHFMPSAEELELTVSTSRLTFRAFRDPARVRAADRLTKVDTTVRSELGSFGAVRMPDGWRAALRLKEFRLMVDLAEQLSKTAVLLARVDEPGEPLMFLYVHPALNCEFAFTFATRTLRAQRSDGSVPGPGALVVNGTADEWLLRQSGVVAGALSGPRTGSRAGSRAGSIGSSLSSRVPSRAAVLPVRRSMLVSQSTEGDPESVGRATSDVPDQDAETGGSPISAPREYLADLLEVVSNDVGMTQGAEPARGLFD